MPEQNSAPADSTVPPAAAPGKKSKWLIILPLLLVLTGGSAAGLWFFRSRPASAKPKPEEPKVKTTLHLESFVINLADPDQKAYLRVGIDIGLSKLPAKKEAEGDTPTALIRDTIVGVLALSKPDELLTAEGKTKLKDDLLHALQQRAPDLGTEEIYFTEFLIQR